MNKKEIIFPTKVSFIMQIDLFFKYLASLVHLDYDLISKYIIYILLLLEYIYIT